jgi:hypothetical protein
MDDQAAFFAGKTFPHAPPIRSAPAAPFRRIGGVDEQDRYSPAACAFLHKAQQGDKGSIFKGKPVRIHRSAVLHAMVREELFKRDPCTRVFCKPDDTPGNPAESRIEFRFPACFCPADIPDPVHLQSAMKSFAAMDG